MTRAPRVLVATPVFPPVIGGAELLAHRIATNLHGFDVRVVTLHHPEASSVDPGRVRVVRTRLRSGARHSLKALNGRVLLEAVRFRPDALLSIHVSLAPAAVALQALRVPFVQYVYAKEFGVYPRVARLAMSRADAIIAISRYTAMLASRAGAPPGRVFRVLPGVDVPATPQARSTRDADPILITVSRLDDTYKGHDVIIQALPLIRRAVPDASWVVIGDGPLRSYVEAAAAKFPDGALRVLGRLPDAERDQWLGRAHVFVLPSRVPDDLAGGEGFGIAALEASAHGLPVVAGKHGGTEDAVIDGETGLLVDPTRPKDVAAAVIRLLTDPAEATRMGQNGRVRAGELSWEHAADEVADVLRVVIRKAGWQRMSARA